MGLEKIPCPNLVHFRVSDTQFIMGCGPSRMTPYPRKVVTTTTVTRPPSYNPNMGPGYVPAPGGEGCPPPMPYVPVAPAQAPVPAYITPTRSYQTVTTTTVEQRPRPNNTGRAVAAGLMMGIVAERTLGHRHHHHRRHHHRGWHRGWGWRG